MSLPDSFFASAVKQVDVEIDGETHQLHFKELSATEWNRFALIEASGDEEKKSKNMARLLSLSLCEPDGKPVLTEAKAAALKPGPLALLFSKMLEANKAGKPEAE